MDGHLSGQKKLSKRQLRRGGTGHWEILNPLKVYPSPLWFLSRFDDISMVLDCLTNT